MTLTPRRRIISAVALSAILSTTLAGSASATVSQDPTTTTTTPPTTTVAPPAPPAPAAPPVLFYLPLGGELLAEGANSPEVFLMQVTLVSRGFWLQDAPSNFGASTRHALVAFQKYMGLPRSGKLDPFTRFVLGATMDRATPNVPTFGRGVEVDIARQVMIVSENGVTNWVFDISTGKSSTPTPRGSFKVTRQINGQRISKLGQLWRPKYFTGGYALHGSPSVPNYPASHGCVRMTNQEINFIWDTNLIPVGTPVKLY